MNFEKYQHYELHDFIEDASFRNWAADPDGKEAPFWRGYLRRYPERAALVAEARRLLEDMNVYFAENGRQDKPADDNFLHKLRAMMAASKAERRRLNRRLLVQRRSVAAAVLLLLGMGLWYLLTPAFPQQRIATGYGEWKTVTLPDGSRVELNSNSEIRLAEAWQPGADRKVWLTGEAFFQVTKDPKRPKFHVITEDLTIEVLGTAFNVHSRGERTEVFLEEGKVRVDLGTEETYLNPGELIAYSARNQSVAKFHQVPAERHTSWKDGALILQDRPVAEVFAKLEEIYGLTIIGADTTLLRERKTVAIPMDRIEVAAPILERILNVEITLQDKRMMINKKPE